MDIKTAMALRNYGINPHKDSQLTQKNNAQSGFKDITQGIDFNDAIAPTKKQNFSEVMKNVASEAVGTLQNAEQTAMDGLNNKADVQSVVEAMAKAEMTVKTVTAVRDKVIEAYQEILRMPI